MDKLQQLAAEMEAQGYKGSSTSPFGRVWNPHILNGNMLNEVFWLFDDGASAKFHCQMVTTLQYQTPDGFKHGFRFKAPLK